MCHKVALKLVSNMPDSNHDWKSRYFFVKGFNWVCRPDEWKNIGEGYDHTLGIMDKSGESLGSFSYVVYRLLPYL